MFIEEKPKMWEFSEWVLNSNVYFYYTETDFSLLVKINILLVEGERKMIGRLLIDLYYYLSVI